MPIKTYRAFVLMCCTTFLLPSAIALAEDSVPKDQLVASHQTLTMHRLMPLGLACHQFLTEHSRFPTKPSDLRTVVGDDWRSFFASYDYIKTFDAPDGADKDALWAWIDKNTSFTINGDRFDADKLPNVGRDYNLSSEGLIVERKPLVQGKMISLAVDGSAHFTPVQ